MTGRTHAQSQSYSSLAADRAAAQNSPPSLPAQNGRARMSQGVWLSFGPGPTTALARPGLGLEHLGFVASASAPPRAASGPLCLA